MPFLKSRGENVGLFNFWKREKVERASTLGVDDTLLSAMLCPGKITTVKAMNIPAVAS
ncbi:MAG: hypothetical protein LBR79_06855 [Oscillospiraceae bacterium]|nr:hypothetical protein [Oscillospiraceae bacterium]